MSASARPVDAPPVAGWASRLRSAPVNRALPLEVLAPVLAITLIAKLGAFLPGYAVDDYSLAAGDSRVPFEALLAQGRFGQAVLLEILARIGLLPHYTRFFFVALAMLVTAICATLVVRLWRVDSPRVAVAGAALIAIHPFTTEIFTFRTALGIHAIAFLLLIPLLVPRQWTWRALSAATLAFALVLSIYQIVLQYLLMVVIVGLAIEIASEMRREPGSRFRLPFRDRFLALAGISLAGTALYLVINAALLRFYHVTMIRRGRLLEPGAVVTRLHDVWTTLRYRYLEPNPMTGATMRTLLLALLAAAVLGLVLKWRRQPLARTLPRLAAVFTLLILGALWTITLPAIVEFFWPVPRSMAHVAILWGGVLVIACSAWGVRMQRALGVLAALILLGFIGTDNRILADQQRLNLRDLALANRLVARLEATPGFTPAAEVAIVGLQYAYPLPLATSDLDMNSSAFGANWSNLAILREVSGYNLQDPGATRTAAAADRCRAVAPWPASSAVTVENGLVIICFNTPPPATP